MQNTALNLTERGVVPDSLIRAGIRLQLKDRLREIDADNIENAAKVTSKLMESMRHSRIAELPELANAQHYEVPAGFFDKVLGSYKKYSCGYWPHGTSSLDGSEAHALAETVRHADLFNGQRVLELGCGWGSLSLYMAERFPLSRITAVSNSHGQAEYIRQQIASRNLDNLEVITADMNDFEAGEKYDRVVSVEMFEHMRNWEALFGKVKRWLNQDGRFFMHIFVHRSTPYLFEDKGPTDWMSRHFFSGGMMPSSDLPLQIYSELRLEKRWFWSGLHYARTSNAWLAQMDNCKDELMPLFNDTYGADFAAIWWQRWRIFFMACAELFAYRQGQEWFVGHYLFSAKD